MICRPCREAGAMLKASRDLTQGAQAVLLAEVYRLHYQCQFSTCPCQHRIT